MNRVALARSRFHNVKTREGAVMMDRQRAVDEIRMLQMERRREEMIRWLIQKKKFSPKGASKCIANFLESMRYVLEETGRLP